MYKFDITHSSARFITRTAFDAIGGFDERITAGEDYDFQNRLNKAGYRTGFVIPEALHLGEPTSFLEHMAAYYSYGRDFVAYVKQNRSASRRQLSPVRNIYLKHWRRFARHPLRGLAFIGYTFCKFTFGGAGFLMARFATRATPQDSI
jgi:GT2 family glycosyltransferase